MKNKIPSLHQAKMSKLAIHIILIAGSLIMVMPFVWMFLTSFKTYGESIAIPLTFLPEKWRLDNYQEVNQRVNFLVLYINTIIVIAARVLCALVFSSMAGYAFSRLQFRGRNVLFSIVIIQMMIPSQVGTIPQYLMTAKLGLLDTVAGIIFPGIVSAFGAFFMRQAFMSLPRELEEAAKIDGCNHWQIFYRIMLPQVKTPMMALSIFTALFAWKDLMWPLIINVSPEKMTISAGLAMLKGQFLVDYPVIMAGAVFSTLPMILIYICLQKHFVEGVSTSGIK